MAGAIPRRTKREPSTISKRRVFLYLNQGCLLSVGSPFASVPGRYPRDVSMRLSLSWQLAHKLWSSPCQNIRSLPWCSTTWSATVAGMTTPRVRHMRQSGSAFSWARDIFRQRSSMYQFRHPLPLGQREDLLAPLPGPPIVSPFRAVATLSGAMGAGCLTGGRGGPAGSHLLGFKPAE